MRVEKLKEKWYEFDRYHLKDSYIDVFISSSYHNPNYDFKPLISFAAFSKYYRLSKPAINGHIKWFNSMHFKCINGLEEYFSENITANDLWYRFYKFELKSEKLKEKWFEFTRYYFEDDGYIDVAIEDLAEDLNSDEPSNYIWNEFNNFFRLNGGLWYNQRHFSTKVRDEIKNKISIFPSYDFTSNFDSNYKSKEIWNRYFSE